MHEGRRRVLPMRMATFFAALLLLAVGPFGSRVTGQVKPTSLTIQAVDAPWLPGFQKLAQLYEQQAGVKLNLNITPFPGMRQKSFNAVTAPVSEFDIMMLNEQWYMPFYAGRLVTRLDGIDPGFTLPREVIEYEWAPRWDPVARYSTPKGDLYGVPINGNIQVFFYRSDLFREAGLSAPQTWDQVEAAARKFHNPPQMYGFVVRTNPPDFEWQAYLHSYGGSIIRQDTATGEWEVTVHRPEAVAALERYIHLGKTFGPPNYANISQADMIALMVSGRLAMVHMVVAAIADLENPARSTVVGKVEAAPVPGTTPARRATISGIWIIAVPHNIHIQRKRAALGFMKWAIGKEAQIRYAESGAIPVRRDVFEELSSRPGFRWMRAVVDSTQFIKGHPRLAETPQIIQAIDRRIGQAFIGELKPADALWEVAREVHEMLQRGGYKVKLLTR